MKKPTMIIGKKQIILAGMTLILGLAVYINYAVSTSDGKIKATDVVKSQSVNYGDAQLVSTDSASDYFAQARQNEFKGRGGRNIKEYNERRRFHRGRKESR